MEEKVYYMLSSRLIELRKKHKLSQKSLCERINISRATYSNYELGNRSPDFGTLELIASFYNVSVDYLLGRTDNHIVDGNESTDVFDELKKISRDVGISRLAFFDENSWKDFTPDDLVEIEKHFEYIVHKVKERKRNKEGK